MPKFYVTKYALTAGIQEVEAEEPTEHAGMLSVKVRGGAMHYHGEGKDWHRTHESAVARAEKMRYKKLASLSKRVVELTNLKFV